MPTQSTPQKFGRYTLTGEIGRGELTSVYRAVDPRYGREVAIKVLRLALPEDPAGRDRIEKEARRTAALQHPAIVRVYDHGEEAGQSFFVMRYMPGGSLQDRLEAGPLSLAAARRMLDRLAGALDEAHTRGILHSHLNPNNVLFDEHGEAFLTDFGTAQLKESLSPEGGEPARTAYMSPEQIRGDQLDARADVYSLGMILSEAITGKLPENAEAPTLPEPVRQVIDKATAQNRDERFSSAGELAAAFSAVTANEIEPESIPAKAPALPTRPTAIPAFEMPQPAAGSMPTSQSEMKTKRAREKREPKDITPRLIIFVLVAFLVFTCLFGGIGAYMGYRNYQNERATQTASAVQTDQVVTTVTPVTATPIP